MGVSAPVAPKANGLSTVFNVITAPREAFETLRIAPMWGWAFLVAAILTAAGQYIATPAVLHAIQISTPQQIAASPRGAQMTPEQIQSAVNVAVAVAKLSWLWAPLTILIGALVPAVIMLLFKAVGRGEATFKQLWCASVNITVVSGGIGALVGGLIAVVRGAGSYNSPADAYKAMPSVAWLVPHAAVKLVAFLTAFNVIGIWGAALVALAMMYVAKTSKANGALCGLAILCIAGGFFAAGAR